MFRSLIAVSLAAALAACAPQQAAVPRTCAISGLEKVGGPIALVDEAGKPVTKAAFAGRPTLLYFGFASCPDVCPTALQTLAKALETRPAGATPITVALISVDPGRDTPEKLAQYVSSDAFPPGTRGFTGTQAQIDAAKTAFRAYASRRDTPESAMGYVMDHSSLFYLMDGQWRIRALFPSSLAPADMAACVDAGLAKR